MRALVLIRHGVTDWNRDRLLQGHTDIGLNAEGFRQANALARRMGETQRPDVLYVSDLRRARDTARAMEISLGISARTAPELRERSWGDFEGKTWHQVRDFFRDGGVSPPDPLTYRPPNGESHQDFAARVCGYIRGLEQRHAGQTVWVVSHGGVIRVLLESLLGEANVPRDLRVGNTSVSVLQNGVQWAAETIVCTSHLETTTQEEEPGG